MSVNKKIKNNLALSNEIVLDSRGIFSQLRLEGSLLFIPIVLSFSMLIGCADKSSSPDEVRGLYQKNEPIKPLPEYTKDRAREWEKFAPEHVPIVRRSTHNGEPAILIEVPLKNPNFEHYIEKIGIMDDKRKEIISVTLERNHRPKTFAYFPLSKLPQDKKYAKNLKAFAKCNLHDLWTSPIPEDILNILY